MKKILSPGSKIKNPAPTNCSQSLSGHEYVLFLAIRGLVPMLLNDLGTILVEPSKFLMPNFANLLIK